MSSVTTCILWLQWNAAYWIFINGNWYLEPWISSMPTFQKFSSNTLKKPQQELFSHASNSSKQTSNEECLTTTTWCIQKEYVVITVWSENSVHDQSESILLVQPWKFYIFPHLSGFIFQFQNILAWITWWMPILATIMNTDYDFDYDCNYECQLWSQFGTIFLQLLKGGCNPVVAEGNFHPYPL